MTNNLPPVTHTLSLDAEGRLTLPVPVRQALGWTAGDRLVLTISDNVVQLVRLSQQTHTLRGILKNPDPSQSVVDELIRDRRRSAQHE
jgi:bifunctional DNA-binding transcriptional regulator/antitoxin component of YhaV-PrlF toxin-antitoxin module